MEVFVSEYGLNFGYWKKANFVANTNGTAVTAGDKNKLYTISPLRYPTIGPGDAGLTLSIGNDIAYALLKKWKTF